jgi:hypothetical protein
MVGRVCLKCRAQSDHVALDELPQLQCEYCDTFLTVSQEIERHRNYYYLCPECPRQWRLASFLPRWGELFPYSGLAADQDIRR